MGVNVAGIASQYQKALSHVATALASQTAAEVYFILIFVIINGLVSTANGPGNIQ